MAPRDKTEIKQTILYYPTISVPSGRWLRQAVLYWDEIGSIVPQRYDRTALIPYTPDVQYLKAEGEFRPFRTDLIYQRQWKLVQDFENELREIVRSSEFQAKLAGRSKKTLTARVHQDKVSHEVFDFLESSHLAKRQAGNQNWYFFELSTALLYMSLLAKYLANADETASTVAGTNLPFYQRLNFGAESISTALPSLNVRFFNILPVPRQNNSLADIITFKRKRQDQLKFFRNVVGDTQLALAKCKSNSQVNQTLADFDATLKKGLTDLEAVLKDSKISTVAGSLEALVKVSYPGWLATGAVASGRIKHIADLPLKWTLGGTLVAGAIGVGRYLIDKRNERRATHRNSAFSCLHAAKRESVL